MATRVGIDLGGTFTDAIFYDGDTGEVRVAKYPSNREAGELSVLAALDDVLRDESAARVELFLHATTVGLNALLERTGVTVALLTTRGFRDVLEIRRGDREDIFDPFWVKPKPLVDRSLRYPVAERTGADGSVINPLDEADVKAAAKLMMERGVDSVAISFFNAYANPEHELLAAEMLQSEGFDGEISLSHAISREYREYERTSTAVVDAYVRPTMASYLKRLSAGLVTRDFAGRSLMTRSGGGALSFDEAARQPVETIMSGPVAGAAGAAELARHLGIREVLTADVGGTSFDTTLIIDGSPEKAYEGRVMDYPIQTEWIDVRSIGAGGGSVAFVDPGGLLRVGPRSAGAQPGPACYGKGGTEATVTDAALYLGMLGSGSLASGLELDRELAEAAIAPLASSLSMEPHEVARGIITIANSGMANAMREISIEQGRDPRAMALLAFGGAGPLFSSLLASELDIERIIVPPHAGNFSAWGLLGADLTRSSSVTTIRPLSDECLHMLNRAAQDLFVELEEKVEAVSDAGARRSVHLDLRYLGQDHALTIQVPTDDDGAIAASPDDITALFAEEYERTYDVLLDEGLEVVSLRVSTSNPLPARTESQPSAVAGEQGVGTAYSFSTGDWLDFELVNRETLGFGDIVVGPAIVEEATSTTYIDRGQRATVVNWNCLEVKRETTA